MKKKNEYIKGQLRKRTLKEMDDSCCPSIVKEMAAAVLDDKMIEKHLLTYTWTSGSSTVVYPIMIWKKEITLQMDGNEKNRDAYNKAIARVCTKYPHLFCNGWVSNYDGSCPMSISFSYTNQTLERLADAEKPQNTD